MEGVTDHTEGLSVHRNNRRLTVGIVLIVLGVLFFVDQLDVFEMDVLWTMWPLILIGIGISKLTRPAGSGGRRGGAVLIVLGTWLQLDALQIVYVDDSWPFLLIAVGAMMVVNSLRHSPPVSAPLEE